MQVFYEDRDGKEHVDPEVPKRLLKWKAGAATKGTLDVVTQKVRKFSFAKRKDKDSGDESSDPDESASYSSSPALFVHAEWLFGHKYTALRVISCDPRPGGSPHATCVLVLADEMDFRQVPGAEKDSEESGDSAGRGRGSGTGRGRGRGAGRAEAPPSNIAPSGRGRATTIRGNAGRGAREPIEAVSPTLERKVVAEQNDILKEALTEFEKLRNTYSSEKHTLLTVGGPSRVSPVPLAERVRDKVIETAREMQIFGLTNDNVVTETASSSEVYMLSGVLYYLTRNGYAKLIVVVRRCHVERVMMLWTRVRGMVKVAFLVHPVDDLPLSMGVEAKMQRAQKELELFSKGLATPRTPSSGRSTPGSGRRRLSRRSSSGLMLVPGGSPDAGLDSPKLRRQSVADPDEGK